MPFALTMLALLARFRVLVLQVGFLSLKLYLPSPPQQLSDIRIMAFS
jgi:hypothetical protein